MESDEFSFVLTRHWRKLGLAFDRADFTDAQAIPSTARNAGGNFRRLHRLLVQNEGILKIGGLSVITGDVVDAARSALVIRVTSRQISLKKARHFSLTVTSCTLYTVKMGSVDLRRNAMATSKDIVVTGVSTGIGRATTKVLISKGFRVFGSVRKQADADRLQTEFENGFVPLIMDIADADSVHRAAELVGSMVGDRNLVGLVNNAGIVVSGPLLHLRPSAYRRQLEVNLIAPLVVIQAFAPLLGTDKKRKGPSGRIVNISSTTAKVAIPLLGAYSSSKAGLEAMSDALRRELMLFGIDLVIIEPGTVNTAMYDKGEKEDLSEFKQTEYWEAVQNFQKFIVAEARNNGLSPERLGEAVHVALTTAKPKARYAVVPQRFKNWTLPRLLPARMLDAALAKQLGLKRR